MRHLSVVSWMLLGVAAAGMASAQGDLAKSSSLTVGQTEVRVFFFDRQWMPIDVKNVTGTLDVWPKGGSKHSYPLDAAPHARVEDSLKKEDSGEHARGSGKAHGMICGEVRELDPLHVELLVTPSGRGPTRTDKKADSIPSKGEEAVRGLVGGHDHGVSFLKVMIPDGEIEDPSTKAINFEARLNLNVSGETKTVKGFQYPYGFIENRFDRLTDYDLKDVKEEVKLDPDRAKQVSHKIQATLSALPGLSFKKDDDRREYEKAVSECREACARMENAQGKELEAAINTCRDKCKEVISQAKDAQGAQSGD
ncbi:MAG TPA: hypothetical protein VKU80_07190 [Planctomycetota bacterium]|nr:hypothetical protein [Planctomycetota bacterium]